MYAELEAADIRDEEAATAASIVYHLRFNQSVVTSSHGYAGEGVTHEEVLGAAAEASLAIWSTQPGTLPTRELLPSQDRLGDNMVSLAVLLRKGAKLELCKLVEEGGYNGKDLLRLAVLQGLARWTGPRGEAQRVADFVSADAGRSLRAANQHRRRQREATTLWQEALELLARTGLPVVHLATSSVDDRFEHSDTAWLHVLDALSRDGSRALLADHARLTTGSSIRSWTGSGGSGWGGDGLEDRHATSRSAWVDHGEDSLLVVCIPTREAEERGERAARRVILVAAHSLEAARRVRDAIVARIAEQEKAA